VKIPVNLSAFFCALFLFCFVLIDNSKSQETGSGVKGSDGKAAQEAGYENLDESKKQFQSRNFKTALKGFLVSHKSDPQNAELNYKIAQCYLNANLDKSKAISYIEFATAQPQAQPDWWFELGRAYHFNKRFDDAIVAFEKYIGLVGKKEKEIKKARRMIEICKNAKEFTAKPLNLTFENLGRKINSEFADYYPLLPSNGSMLIFTTRRKGNTGGVLDPDGYYTSEIYYAENKAGSLTKAKNIGVKLNTEFDEEAVGLSPDGKNLMVYIDHENNYGDLFLSKWDKKSYQLAEDVGPTVNTNRVETAGATNEDATVMFFASFKSGGKGGSDIWMVRKLPTGQWGLPENLGDEINTEFNEDFPMIDADGKTLYFASDGWKTMGGFDVFKSVYDSATAQWSTPQNLGYPLNDMEDNMVVSFLKNRRFAYVSAYRKDGIGDLDIYRVINNNLEAKKSVLALRVSGTDTAAVVQGAKITVKAAPADNVYGEYKTRKNGKAAVILDGGKYNLVVEAKGFKTLNREINVDNLSLVTEKIPMNILLESDGSVVVEKKGKDGKTTSKTKEGGKSGGSPEKKATPAKKSP
jgi:tetratricopeptide (TPR) repeat protein